MLKLPFIPLFLLASKLKTTRSLVDCRPPEAILTCKQLRNPYFCRNLSTQYSASHEAYEIQVTGLTRSLAQMEEQLRLANEDRVSLKAPTVRALVRLMVRKLGG